MCGEKNYFNNNYNNKTINIYSAILLLKHLQYVVSLNFQTKPTR